MCKSNLGKRHAALGSAFADVCLLFPPSLLPYTSISAAMPTYRAPVFYSKPRSYPALQLATSPVTLAPALTGHAGDEITDLIWIKISVVFCCLDILN